MYIPMDGKALHCLKCSVSLADSKLKDIVSRALILLKRTEYIKINKTHADASNVNNLKQTNILLSRL
jgi:hypothetical protein